MARISGMVKNCCRLLLWISIPIAAIVVGMLVAAFIAINTFFAPAESMKDMVRIFEKNRNDIQQVVDTLQALEFSNVRIDNTNTDFRYITVHDSLPVTEYAYNNDETLSALQVLFIKQKCLVIHKEKDYIYFQWWASFNSGRGIVYSMSGEVPKMFEEFGEYQELSIEPLVYKNWYYYYHRVKSKKEVEGN